MLPRVLRRLRLPGIGVMRSITYSGIDDEVVVERGAENHTKIIVLGSKSAVRSLSVPTTMTVVGASYGTVLLSNLGHAYLLNVRDRIMRLKQIGYDRPVGILGSGCEVAILVRHGIANALEIVPVCSAKKNMQRMIDLPEGFLPTSLLDVSSGIWLVDVSYSSVAFIKGDKASQAWKLSAVDDSVAEYSQLDSGIAQGVAADSNGLWYGTLGGLVHVDEHGVLSKKTVPGGFLLEIAAPYTSCVVANAGRFTTSGRRLLWVSFRKNSPSPDDEPTAHFVILLRSRDV